MMQRILTSLSLPTNNFKLPDHDNFMSRLNTNIEKLSLWRKNKITYIPNHLFLYSLIYSLPKSKTLQDYELLDSRVTQVVKDSNIFGLTTIFDETPPVQNGVLSGRCLEQWMGVSETQDTNRISADKLRPIRCIWHPFSTLNYWLDEPTDITNDKVSFFVVDIGSLMLLVNHHYRKNDNFTTKDFISKIIYPSLMEDIINITLFNRLSNINFNADNTDDKPRNSPVWLNLNNESDYYHNALFEELQKGDNGVNYLAQNIYLTEYYSLFDFLLSLPSVPSVRNVSPLFFTAICNYLILLLDINVVRHGIKDRTLNNYLKTQIDIIENDKTVLSLNETLNTQQNNLFEIMKKLIG